KVIIIPWKIAGRYNFSAKVISLFGTSLALLDNEYIIFSFLCYYLTNDSTAPVPSMLIIPSGIRIFQPRRINWSYLNLGSVHLIHIKKNIPKNILANKATTPRIVTALCDNPRSCINGKLYPPKYSELITAEEINILMYSANR